MGLLRSVNISCFLLLSLSFCAQSRRGNVQAADKEVWGAQQICSYDNAQEPLRCISIEPHITDNKAVIDVLKLDFNPGQVPYRVLARPAGSSLYDLLASNVTVPQGSFFEVKPIGKTYIEEYEEWVIETMQNKSPNGLNITTVGPGNGVVLIKEFVNYPEFNSK
ncbi:MAG: hypothetical protein KA116_11885 [Proteobacteria bacterium]|nr:hypothetical protein [Pseudomonadota bacterium]